MADRHVLAIVPEHIGGRAVGARLTPAFEGLADVAIVERADEDPAALAHATVIITGLAPITGQHLAAAAALELVQCASHGFDYVDLEAARARGVKVANIGSTGAEKQNVAEQTFTLMLTLAKQVIPAHLALRDGEWALPRLQRSITELSEKTLGLVGFGQIAREVAHRAAAFGMTTIYTDRRRASPEVERASRVRFAELDDLLREADYISLHAPLTEETQHLLDARRLALLKPTAFLVNTARGALVDQKALADALEAGTLAGAGIDVFDPEPPPAALRLLRAPNVVLSPHVAGVTRETLMRIAQAAVINVMRYLATGELHDVVS
ncbi:MAG: NAD(P)-dependent oxidoreductase [Candidatus Dormiibacterota bacterium]